MLLTSNSFYFIFANFLNFIFSPEVKKEKQNLFLGVLSGYLYMLDRWSTSSCSHIFIFANKASTRNKNF